MYYIPSENCLHGFFIDLYPVRGFPQLGLSRAVDAFLHFVTCKAGLLLIFSLAGGNELLKKATLGVFTEGISNQPL